MAAAGGEREQAVRAVCSVLRQLRYGYRRGRGDLPGRPDIVLPRWRLAVFVVDCGRYPHPGCPRRAAEPCAGDGNRQLAQDCGALGALGWETLVIQECEAAEPTVLGYRVDVAVRGNLVAPTPRPAEPTA